jgi:arylsulfatase A-like enzyme
MARRPLARIALGFALAAATAIAAPGSAKPERRPNFVIFLVDMLRADHLGVYGYPKHTSPHLDELAKRGIVLENAYSAAPWTFPSTVSLLTGLFPSEHGAGDRRIDPETRTITYPANVDAWLPVQFARHGYATVAFHSHAYLRRSVSSIHDAFQEYYYTPQEKEKPQPLRIETPGLSSNLFLDTLYPPVERWLKTHRRDQPFLMYVHVLDVRGPYPDMALLDEDRPEVERAIAAGKLSFSKRPGLGMYQATDLPGSQKAYLYDGHVHKVDEYLGRLEKTLETLGIADDTYVIVTADHGEGFGEHDFWGHGRTVTNDQVHVPLVFLSHRDVRAKAGRIASHVNTVGLLPTLASLAGIQLEPFFARRGFGELLSARPAPSPWRYVSISDGAYEGRFAAITLDGRYKLITDRKTGAHSFYDLRTDPGEQVALDPARVAPALRTRLDELVAQQKAIESAPARATSHDRDLDEATERDLKAIGYVR